MPFPIIVFAVTFGGAFIYYVVCVYMEKHDQKKASEEERKRILSIRSSKYYTYTLEKCKQHITRRLNEIEEDMKTKAPSQWNLKGLSISVHYSTIDIDYLGRREEKINLSDFYISFSEGTSRHFTLLLYNDLSEYYEKFTNKLDIEKHITSSGYDSAWSHTIDIRFSKILHNKIKEI